LQGKKTKGKKNSRRKRKVSPCPKRGKAPRLLPSWVGGERGQREGIVEKEEGAERRFVPRLKRRIKIMEGRNLFPEEGGGGTTERERE